MGENFSKEELINLYQDCGSLSDMSRLTNKPYTYFYNEFRKLGIKINELKKEIRVKKFRFKNRNYTKGDLIILYRKYRSLKDIARATNIPYHHLCREVQRLGIKIGEIKREKKAYSPELARIIRLFKKYGFLPYISKKTGISTTRLRELLTRHFGIGLNQLRNNLCDSESYKKIRAGEKSSRYQQVKEAYERLGTLEKVGKELGITRERVRQILAKGEWLGLFKLEKRRDRLKRLKRELTRESLTKEIQSLCYETKLCLKLGINSKELRLLLQHFSIDFQEYQLMYKKGRYINRYAKIVDELGYHPTTTEMNSRPEWRAVWAGVSRHWDSIDNFRKEFGIEKPKMRIHPNTILAFKKSKEKRKLIKIEKKEKVLNLIKQEGPISAALVRNKLGLKSATTRNYIRELSKEGLISKIGEGAKVKYTITTNKT